MFYLLLHCYCITKLIVKALIDCYVSLLCVVSIHLSMYPTMTCNGLKKIKILQWACENRLQ